MPMPFGFRNYLSILIANAVTHFDNALYGYLVPIIAPMCFPGQTVINQLILGYSMLMLAFLAKPLGVVVFSKMVARKKEIFVLRYTLFGIGLGLLVIGIFSVQNTWYNYGLCFARWCIEACSAGEYAIAKLYILNSVDNKMAKQCSVWYEVSTMLGIILAGSIGTAFACRPSLSCYWQLPFILASLITWGNFFFFEDVWIINMIYLY